MFNVTVSCFCYCLLLSQVDDWLERLIDEKGEDLYRMKGILSVSGYDQRYVFQARISSS